MSKSTRRDDPLHDLKTIVNPLQLGGGVVMIQSSTDGINESAPNEVAGKW
jgi:hypothetical protein